MTVLNVRKKPVEVQAMLYDGTVESAQAIMRWANVGSRIEHFSDGKLGIVSLEHGHPAGGVLASAGDYIIRGIKGEFYPCKPDIFAGSYEPATVAIDYLAEAKRHYLVAVGKGPSPTGTTEWPVPDHIVAAHACAAIAQADRQVNDMGIGEYARAFSPLMESMAQNMAQALGAPAPVGMVPLKSSDPCPECCEADGNVLCDPTDCTHGCHKPAVA